MAAELLAAHRCAIEAWQTIGTDDEHATIARAWIRISTCRLVVALVYYDEDADVWRWNAEGVTGDARNLKLARAAADASTRRRGHACGAF